MHTAKLIPEPPAEAASVVLNLRMDQIEADPDQPRKVFDRAALSELAASIRADGLLQPITVRQLNPCRYMIVAGERRFRASLVNKAPAIRAIVIVAADMADIRVKQIIENDQRMDVTPLEQARSYQALMDASGWSVEDLSTRIGKAAHRIVERTVLLRLKPEHLALLASGNLKPSEATEMARLGPRGQDLLIAAIRDGKCRSFNDLRAMSTALLAAESQASISFEQPMQPTAAERQLTSAFEAQVEKIAGMLRSGIRENQIVAVQRTNPHRAGHLADLMACMQKDLRRIELALRSSAVQADFHGSSKAAAR